MARYIDADKVMEEIARMCGHDLCEWSTLGVKALIERQPTADVAPRAEVAREIFEEIEEIFEKFKMRQCSNSVCAWCVHATDYGRRNEECDKPYVDKNGKEQKACYVYAKFESLIDKELAELKKEYTEEKK